MIKRNVAFILMISLLAIIFAGNAHAQFWKKKSKRKHKQEQSTAPASDSTAAPQSLTKEQKKEKKHKEKEERKKQKREKKHKGKTDKKKDTTTSKPTTKATVPAIKNRADIVFPPSQIKARYRIDVLAPLYLDDLVKGQYITYNDKIPEKALPGISFVQGVNIAADSLKKAGFKVDIYIHDVSTFNESAEMLTSKGKLDSTDLIIGAVQTKDIAVVAAFAKKKHIYFISALSASDGGVKDNQYFTLLQPSFKSNTEWIVQDIARNHPGKKITLLYRTVPAMDATAYNYITSDTSVKISFQPLLCNALPSKKSLLSVIDTTKNNIVVVPVMDMKYADSILHALSHDFTGTHFEIYGMPSWSGLAELNKAKSLPNMIVNVTGAFNFNQASVSGQFIERNFKKDYSGKTSEMVYCGYETLFWYAHLLKQYGTIFKYTDNAPTPFTPFEIAPQWDKNNDLLYNENRHIFVTKYEAGNTKIE